ncbi:zinc finger, CCHC-type containing protein [Tanacetum coccineum]
MKSHDVAFWKEEINDEIDSIMGKNTWVLADLPSGCKPLVCKWILKRKLKVDRTIEKFKARLVIQGFKQKSWIDYFDTYALVAHISTIRFKFDETGEGVIICLYVDDMLIFGTNQVQVDLKKEFLSSKFSMKDMGRLMLSWAVSQLEYSRLISYLMYIMTCIRPDIAFAMGKLGILVIMPSVLEGYTDARWISNTEDNSSISGWVFLRGGDVIS